MTELTLAGRLQQCESQWAALRAETEPEKILRQYEPLAVELRVLLDILSDPRIGQPAGTVRSFDLTDGIMTNKDIASQVQRYMFKTPVPAGGRILYQLQRRSYELRI
ncbi:MAG TPA: hypothetical protein VJI32_02175 [Candidatus Nanoarchaeia archaeon]|nr:hypothetical protein [Candidatus Nanoarchaeia archaeon]